MKLRSFRRQLDGNLVSAKTNISTGVVHVIKSFGQIMRALSVHGKSLDDCCVQLFSTFYFLLLTYFSICGPEINTLQM